MGKNVLVSMLIMSMLLNVAVGIFDPLKNVANQAQKEVKDIAKQAFGRKTMEKNGKAQMGAGDFDQGQKNAGKVDEAKFFFNPLDPIGNFNREGGKVVMSRKTMEEDDHDCDNDHESENNAESNESENGDSDDTNDAGDSDEGQDIKEIMVNAARK
ncbi:hypothetical protein AB3S75_043057 [Citrus x aurantiifolia]